MTVFLLLWTAADATAITGPDLLFDLWLTGAPLCTHRTTQQSSDSKLW
jgi:hypothetical protein